MKTATHRFERNYDIPLTHNDQATCRCGRLERNACHAEPEPTTPEQAEFDARRTGEER